MTSASTIRVEARDGVGWITLDRPPLNVLNIAMMRELGAAVERLAPENRFLIFQGAGTKGFSAGADVGDHSPERVGEMLEAFHGVFRRLWAADCLTVAAVHGWCLGGGCELACFCDFVVAAESAVFGQPEIKLGAVPPVAMVWLPRLVGPRAAWDIILTGRNVPAGEAQKMGLVTRLATEEGLGETVRSLVGEMEALSPAVLKMARDQLRARLGMDFESELAEVERFYLGRLMRTSDAAEGIRAFLDKRAPAWTGR
ncbi:MAG TPA: enoyl-CoA hydratase/isomerase family protein [Candidatus Acidoferrales bacterium]|nr:enoyl-CoA hydratase/isomerase family protein [Candidatus Acidoferrales bacterium]